MFCTHLVQPQTFQKMRADLASMWSPISKTGNTKRICAKAGLQPLYKKISLSNHKADEENTSIKVSSLPRITSSNFYLILLGQSAVESRGIILIIDTSWICLHIYILYVRISWKLFCHLMSC